MHTEEKRKTLLSLVPGYCRRSKGGGICEGGTSRNLIEPLIYLGEATGGCPRPVAGIKTPKARNVHSISFYPEGEEKKTN